MFSIVPLPWATPTAFSWYSERRGHTPRPFLSQDESRKTFSHMLQVSNLSKRYGDDLIFEKVSFLVNVGDRIGLVGPNGCGKTTLLRILVGEEPPDTGSYRYTVPRARVGYLPQALSFREDALVRDVCELL